MRLTSSEMWDRLFNQFWSDLPTRAAVNASPSFQVTTNEDGWWIDVAMPGIDPKHVSLETAGKDVDDPCRCAGRRPR